MPEENVPVDKPSVQEIFEGKDVAKGKELVELLLSDGVGVPVFYKPHGNQKTLFAIDREVGEEDFTVRQKTEIEKHLLGIVMPVPNSQNEYAYLGIKESGFVFSIVGKPEEVERKKRYVDPALSQSLNLGWTRFVDYISSVGNSGVIGGYNIGLTEHSDPEGFAKIVSETVTARRQEQEQVRATRVKVRGNLIDSLFGNKQ